MKYTVQVERKTTSVSVYKTVVEADSEGDARVLARYKARESMSYQWEGLEPTTGPDVVTEVRPALDVTIAEPEGA